MIPGIRCRNCGHEVANAVWDNRESDKVFVHVGRGDGTFDGFMKSMRCHPDDEKSKFCATPDGGSGMFPRALNLALGLRKYDALGRRSRPQ
jgi:hypothetical protein